MPATWAGTAMDQLLSRQAIADGVANGHLIMWSGFSIPTDWSSGTWEERARIVAWGHLIDVGVRLKPGAPDGRNPADPPPVPDWAMRQCVSKGKLLVWRYIILPPTDPVPGIAVERGQSLNPPDARATWTPITDTEDDRYADNVEVVWYANGVQVDSETVPQASGATAYRFFSFGDQVYVRVRYTNSAGVGPQTQSSTLFL